MSEGKPLGVMMVSGQSFTITQRVVSCSFALSPTGRSHGYGETTNSFNVSVSSAWICGLQHIREASLFPRMMYRLKP